MDDDQASFDCPRTTEVMPCDVAHADHHLQQMHVHSLSNTQALALAGACVHVLETGRKVSSVPCGTVLSKTIWYLRPNVVLPPSHAVGEITFTHRSADRGDPS
jgi:hypothetical protein